MKPHIRTFRVALVSAGSLSVGSLLLYFFGIASFARLSITCSAIEILTLLALAWWAWSTSCQEAKRLLIGGIWAGCLATVAYDLVRVPIVHAGIPVFKAISYFGTVLLGQERPTAASEVVGWAYHFSNGVSFALMYAAMARRPGPVTAVIWGLVLEGAMLLTPYAEVFGYQREPRFMAITIGSHVVYGLVLWLCLRSYGRSARPLSPAWMASGLLLAGFGLSAMAADFNGLYARKIPPSPPAYVGPHLYTAWNVPEPDRVAAIWVMQRFVDRDAVFSFIEPFDRVKFGTPFDMPEASVRRSATHSATERLIATRGLRSRKLDELSQMTDLAEITPWLLVANPEPAALAGQVREAAVSSCGKTLHVRCLPAVMRTLDSWYIGNKDESGDGARGAQ